MENEIVLKTRGLSKNYGGHLAVNAVDMEVRRGDIFGFVGRNGAGKTTFMRMVVGTAFPTAGSIELFGSTDLDGARAKIGSLLEAPAFYKDCSARENLKRFAILFGGTDAQIDEILHIIGLADVGNKKAGQFSLGMKQRLGIGIALLGEPEMLLLDEPINGLDPAGIKEVRDLILRLNREKKITFLISSHLLGELSRIATRYGIIHDGNLIEEITPDELQTKCGGKLEIKVDDPDKALEILAPMTEANTVFAMGQTVVVKSHVDEVAAMNRALVLGGVSVFQIGVQTSDLEQYFVERISG